MEDIKGITEETARELTDRFNCCIEHSIAFHGYFNSFIDHICTKAIDEAVEYTHYCLKRYSESWWITRWYWERKLKKSFDRQINVIDGCREIQKLKYTTDKQE